MTEGHRKLIRLLARQAVDEYLKCRRKRAQEQQAGEGTRKHQCLYCADVGQVEGQKND